MGRKGRCCCCVLVAVLAFVVQQLLAVYHVEEPPASFPTVPAAAIPSLLLPGGGRLPVLGLGLCCRITSIGDAVRKSVLWYLLLGGRHLDDAESYGNHGSVGEGIRQAITRGVPREEIFFTTKIPAQHFGTRATTAWFERMLRETGLEYVDLVLLHAAGPGKRAKQVLECGSMPDMRNCRRETWLALSEQRALGRVRHLGVSNFGERQIRELQSLEDAAPVAVNQLEYHPWIPEDHRQAVQFCHSAGIAVTAHSLFGGAMGAQGKLREPVLAALAQTHNCTAAQVLLRWALQSNVSVVTGTGNPRHMRSNLGSIMAFRLSPQEMSEIDKLGRVKPHSVFPYHVPDAIT